MGHADPRIRVAVLGASGYTGAELLRLLAGHPAVDVVAMGAREAAGEPVRAVYPHLAPYADRSFEPWTAEDITRRAEAAFLALPHGASARTAPALVEGGVRVVDLSGDFRLTAEAYPTWYGWEHPAPAWLGKAVYGLPELFGDQVAGADLVANPGCYPTAALLALTPLLRAGMVRSEGIVVDAKSGLTGAGRTPTPTTHFAGAEGSVRPYRPGGTHQHVPEIERGLAEAGVGPVALTFVPHLVPMSRGILATCYARLRGEPSTEEALAVLAEAYAGSRFVRVLPAGVLPDTKRTTGANAVELGAAVDPRTSTAVVLAALDNLVKGAAGQAVQNLNLMLGLPEATGLEAVAVYP